MSLILSLVTKGALLFSKAHIVMRGLQLLVKGLSWVMHSNVGLLGLSQLMNEIWP
jgi:hypothetical protein